jgi:hypothetical protein
MIIWLGVADSLPVTLRRPPARFAVLAGIHFWPIAGLSLQNALLPPWSLEDRSLFIVTSECSASGAL